MIFTTSRRGMRDDLVAIDGPHSPGLGARSQGGDARPSQTSLRSWASSTSPDSIVPARRRHNPGNRAATASVCWPRSGAAALDGDAASVEPVGQPLTSPPFSSRTSVAPASAHRPEIVAVVCRAPRRFPGSKSATAAAAVAAGAERGGRVRLCRAWRRSSGRRRSGSCPVGAPRPRGCRAEWLARSGWPRAADLLAQGEQGNLALRDVEEGSPCRCARASMMAVMTMPAANSDTIWSG